MPNHVYLLLSEPKQQELEDTMRALKTQTSRKLKGSREHFWQRRYFDRNTLAQTEFIEKLRYMHRNPVTSGLVANSEGRAWNSDNHWLTGKPGRIEIEPHWA